MATKCHSAVDCRVGFELGSAPTPDNSGLRVHVLLEGLNWTFYRKIGKRLAPNETWFETPRGFCPNEQLHQEMLELSTWCKFLGEGGQVRVILIGADKVSEGPALMPVVKCKSCNRDFSVYFWSSRLAISGETVKLQEETVRANEIEFGPGGGIALGPGGAIALEPPANPKYRCPFCGIEHEYSSVEVRSDPISREDFQKRNG